MAQYTTIKKTHCENVEVKLKYDTIFGYNIIILQGGFHKFTSLPPPKLPIGAPHVKENSYLTILNYVRILNLCRDALP